MENKIAAKSSISGMSITQNDVLMEYEFTYYLTTVPLTESILNNFNILYTRGYCQTVKGHYLYNAPDKTYRFVTEEDIIRIYSDQSISIVYGPKAK